MKKLILLCGLCGMLACSKNEIVIPGEPKPLSYNTVRIDSVILVKMPAKDPLGKEWDEPGAQAAPDPAFNLRQGSSIFMMQTGLMINIEQSMLPVTLETLAPYEVPDLDETYNWRLIEEGTTFREMSTPENIKFRTYTDVYPKEVLLEKGGVSVQLKLKWYNK